MLTTCHMSFTISSNLALRCCLETCLWQPWSRSKLLFGVNLSFQNYSLRNALIRGPWKFPTLKIICYWYLETWCRDTVCKTMSLLAQSIHKLFHCFHNCFIEPSFMWHSGSSILSGSASFMYLISWAPGTNCSGRPLLLSSVFFVCFAVPLHKKPGNSV